LNGTDTTLILDGVLDGTPCINVGTFENGTVKPKRSKGDGFTYRFNATWKPQKDLLFYATWSKGFRPGGINRQPGLAGYDPDFLINYELGWKTTFGPIRWNGAVYHQLWQKFQFSFLGESSLTVVQNGRDATINGLETDVNYTGGGLTLNAAAAFTDAKTKGNICNFAFGNADCSGLDANGDPDFIAAPSGTRLPVTPIFKITGTARYSWELGVGKAHVQAAAVHQSSARAALKTDEGGGFDSNSLIGKLHPYTLVDLFAGYDWRNMSIELFATNVFDKRDELSRFVVCNLCTAVHVVPGRPRTLGVRAGLKF
jgi:outer membrane receptor protein involved in Fe transport